MSSPLASRHGCLTLLAGFLFTHKCPRCGNRFRRGGVTEWIKSEGNPPVCRECYAKMVRDKASALRET